jgi:hypothetical protein
MFSGEYGPSMKMAHSFDSLDWSKIIHKAGPDVLSETIWHGRLHRKSLFGSIGSDLTDLVRRLVEL